MLLPSVQGASAPAFSAKTRAAVTVEPIRHLLLGNLSSVRLTIQELHQRGYAQTADWSRLVETGQADEVVAILTRPAN